jgi:hypothetical protein
MQVTKQVVRSVKTKRCLSPHVFGTSSFSLAEQDVVLSALLSSLDLLFVIHSRLFFKGVHACCAGLCQDKRKEKRCLNSIKLNVFFN